MSEFAAPMPVLARYAVMVDVGYIYAAAGELLFGTSARRDYRVDAVGLIQAITKHTDELLRGELLRVYWYDAARDRVPTIDQRVVAQMAWVKLRLGNLNARGQQKGVDANIRADMEALARHRAITDAVLIAGDEDMVPAVEAAQAYGVRVHLWGIEPPYGTNQAERLVWESDTVDVLDSSFVRPYFTRNPAAESPRPDVQATVPSPAQLFGEHRPAPARPGRQALAPVPDRPDAARDARAARCRASARTGGTSRRPASTSRTSGSSPGAPTTSATCCPARSCRPSSTRSCSSRRRRSSASRCGPTRRPASGCATRSGRGCTASSASGSASRVAEPYLRVVRGDATPEEVAALVATLTAIAAARSRAADAGEARTRSRATGTPGPGCCGHPCTPRRRLAALRAALTAGYVQPARACRRECGSYIFAA